MFKRSTVSHQGVIGERPWHKRPENSFTGRDYLL
jgi:hypothetical protein